LDVPIPKPACARQTHAGPNRAKIARFSDFPALPTQQTTPMKNDIRFNSAARRLFAGLTLAATALAAMPAQAGPFPDRPITMILSFPPAGATDVLARAVGQKMSEALGQTVVVENRPGAGGNIGLSLAAKAAPDGYTVYMAAVTNAAIAAAAYSPQPAHLIKSFTPVAGVGAVPHMLVVPNSTPATSVSQLVSFLKASPGKYNFASQGAGTLSHLESELFKIKTGVEMVHVPYKGSSQALPELVSGSSAMMFDSIPGSMPLVKAGKLKVLAVASSRRVSSLPNVPTVEEAGVPGFAADNLFGVMVPKGTPPDVVQKLAKAVESAVKSDALRHTLEAQGVELRYSAPEEFGRMVDADFRNWAKVVETAKVKLD
jgi:tripartite-type tricarboxylate transporter receptor subunit TctC